MLISNARFIKFSGRNDHIANMELGSGKYAHRFFSCSRRVEKYLGNEQVLLTVHTDNNNEFEVCKDLNYQYPGLNLHVW